MTDLYFFKTIAPQRWLGLRVPRGLHLQIDEQSQLQPPAPYTYVNAVPMPAWAASARGLVLKRVGDGLKPVLAVLSDAEGGWEPFHHSRTTLGELLEPMPQTSVQELYEAMADAVSNPILPLRMYQAYRDFPAQSYFVEGYNDEQARLALIAAMGASERHQPVETYSELLFIVDSEDAPEEPPANVDTGGTAAELRITAYQSAQGVTLQFEAHGNSVSNSNVVPMIQGQGPDGAEPQFAPFYRWRRTLGLAERPSAESGAVLIPSAVASQALGPVDSAPWAARPFRVTDRLGPRQLAGELLNYQVQLFNAHGRCTHAGRVLLKRQTLEPPLPPLRGEALLVPPEPGQEQARCTITFAISDDQPEPQQLKPLVYYQDYPIVPTGFYGDDDDLALTAARSLADPSGEAFAGGQLTDGQYDSEALPNLSSHNLSPLDMSSVAQTTGKLQLQVLKFSMPLQAGRARRFFLALRREVEGSDISPESPVVALQHTVGLQATEKNEASHCVPHFECFWAPLSEPAWLGEGDARIMEDASNPSEIAPVKIVIQHASTDGLASGLLIGGYRLWMRDVTGPGDDTPFNAVAMVQAVPPLVKAYAPVEVGRTWKVTADGPRATDTAIEKLPTPPHGFIFPSEPAKPTSQPPGEAQAPASQQARNTSIRKAASDLGAENLDASLVLAALQQLRGIGTARDCLLSIATRRAMMPSPGVPLPNAPPGNWVFFDDQLGNRLGRAIQFSLPEGHGIEPGALPYVRYRFIEQPSPQDTVAIDEFGRVVWTWGGLGDRWCHELEWMIEAVPRYAPIQGVRKRLGPEIGNEVMNIRTNGRGQWHRLVVQRREQFDARFAVSQVLDTTEDRFVIALDAPHEFRQSLYNSLARTRQGVLRMHAMVVGLTFRYPNAYATATGELLKAWLGTEQGTTEPRPPRIEAGSSRPSSGGYGEVVCDYPPCMDLTVSVVASADNVYNSSPVIIGPLRRRRASASAITPPEFHVEKPDGTHMEITIPLARLGWFYTGESRPAIDSFLEVVELQAIAELSLLNLPDPEAELMLFFTFDNTQRLVAHFRGSALPAIAEDPSNDLSPEPALEWGTVSITTKFKLTARISEAGHLQIDMTNDSGLPVRVTARWQCEGLAVKPLFWSSNHD